MTTASSFQNGSTPTVVLVHGAFTDASSWAGVIAELQDSGIPVIAVANPLRGPATDAAYLAGVVAAIDGPVLLVGHSYGGVVITRAAAQPGNVVGLVYVTAFALEAGESVLDITGRFPDSLLGPALRPAVLRTGKGEEAVELYLKDDQFPAVFGADLPERLTSVAAVAQRPIAAVAFEESSPTASWKSLPSWYVVATADQAIHPAAQHFMARRAGADTVEVDASHAITLSQPAAVAGHIRTAATATQAVKHTH
ncbi:alpha/beta hydrolase [Nonomuraea glycinis]|uniref:Alpha/beta hydrolase n=1 Tax=Nonomuraea glycinis TaxID=2047744 RepID=A0A918ABT5_9ACTN|nr:alpha/beta hydrolase [Nonomuraea glycinis]MCA2181506.1 alpha/beta hydrolase [Nonomuraea glycinis]GGP14621.1 alpha/beta hydrolase [Nonomuraea glycinis]